MYLANIPPPPKFNIAPEKMMIGRLLSYSDGNFSGAKMLNFQGGIET